LNFQWMMSLQTQLSQTLVAEAQYLGSRTEHLLGFHNTNYVAPAPGGVQSRLPFPSFARIQAEHMGLDAYYHGLGLKLEKRMSQGLTFLGSYTWSKAIDTGSTLNAGPQYTDVNDFWGSARGLSDFDARHRLVLSYAYELPFGKGRRFGNDVSGGLNLLIGGWGVRGVSQFQSGFYFAPSMNLARANYCATACVARPDRVADGNLPDEQQTLTRYWDFTAFVLPPTTAPRAGNGGRNILQGPGINNFDLGIFKNFQITEGFKAEFRYEMFNAFNHSQWGTPSSNVENAATFGQITSMRDPRISQFVLKLIF